ncbi:hypothetical protein [Amycolatopsis sp. H20-H5]|uniref:hypothetical protein n=1 Tax=Amycolatopsis sp. H20-H5 TaxID=3046309 RepID=UPI002DB9A648|nr:hypothetical protein [Amycolatopsis sp. H20-H5]MEC3978879.1 hypothetical protein [Amycolatopsis sp. H20-H5]
MCYADTDTHADGTATAFCYCGWSGDYATPTAADTAATNHERDTEEIDAAIVADAIAANG